MFFTNLQTSPPNLADDAFIFILGSVSERLALPGLLDSAAAKTGVAALAVSLEKKERKKNISLIRPGVVAAWLWDGAPYKQPENSVPLEKLVQKILEAYRKGQRGQLDLT